MMPRSRGTPVNRGKWRIFWPIIEEQLQMELILLQIAWDIRCQSSLAFFTDAYSPVNPFCLTVPSIWEFLTSTPPD